MSREWYNVELTKGEAKIFREYLVELMFYRANLDFEASEADCMIHFECYLTEEEFEIVGNWLEDNLGVSYIAWN